MILLWLMVASLTLAPSLADPPMTCPPNSHPSQSVPVCAPSCEEPRPQGSCATDVQPGCACNEGFLLRNGSCVPTHECACVDASGSVVPDYEIFLTENCSMAYQCLFDSDLNAIRLHYFVVGGCSPRACCLERHRRINCYCVAGYSGDGYFCSKLDSEQESAELREYELERSNRLEMWINGVCTCSVNGLTEYKTFDGQVIDFEGRCNYLLVSTTIRRSEACNFSISVKNEDLVINGIEHTVHVVYVRISDTIFNFTLAPGRQLMVNGVPTDVPAHILPIGLKARWFGNVLSLHAYNCQFGVSFSQDLNVMIHVSKPIYGGNMLGICGDCNRQRDDLRTRGGTDVAGLANRFLLIRDSYQVTPPSPRNAIGTCGAL